MIAPASKDRKRKIISAGADLSGLNVKVKTRRSPEKEKKEKRRRSPYGHTFRLTVPSVISFLLLDGESPFCHHDCPVQRFINYKLVVPRIVGFRKISFDV